MEAAPPNPARELSEAARIHRRMNRQRRFLNGWPLFRRQDALVVFDLEAELVPGLLLRQALE